MRIAFDTNVIIRDRYLRSPNIELFEAFLEKYDAKLIVPKK